MKFSSISLVSCLIVLSSLTIVGVWGQDPQGDATVQGWASTISTAQGCVKQCGETTATDTAYGNLLLQCVDETIADEGGLNKDEQMEDCCRMDSNNGCASAMQNANDVLEKSLTGIKTTAGDYLSCVLNNKNTDNCRIASFCISILTGGWNQNFANDFSVDGDNTGPNSLAQMARTADTCDSMNDFGYRACDNLKGCCSHCAPKIADVVHAVTNELLLPAYSDKVRDCESKSCEEYGVTIPQTRNRRQLVPDDGTISSEEDNNSIGTELAEECTELMKDDVLRYNETYAAEAFMACLFQKMGTIAVMAYNDPNDAVPSTAVTTTSFFASVFGVFIATATTTMMMVA